MASVQERIARVLLQYKIDRKSLAEAEKITDSFGKKLKGRALAQSKELAETKKSADALGVTLKQLERERALSIMAQQSAKVAIETGKSRTAIIALRAELTKVGANSKEIDRVAREFDRLTNAARRAELQTKKVRGNTALRAVGTDIRNLPAVPIPGTPISTDVVGKILASIGRTQVTFDQLAIGFGLLATVGTTVVLVIKEFVDALKETKQRVLDEIASRQQLNGLLVTGTRDALQIELEKLKIQRKINELNLADVAPDFAARFKELADQNLLGFDAFAKVIGLNDPVFAGLEESALAALKALLDSDRAIGVYVEALSSSEVAANTAAAAEEALRQKRQAAADLILGTQLQAQIQLQKLDAANIRERIRGLEFEQKAIGKLIISGEASAGMVDQLSVRLTEATTELNEMRNALPRAEQIENAKRIFENIKTGIEESLEKAADMVKVGQAITELRDDLAIRMREIAIRQREQFEEAEHDRSAAIGEARRDASIAESEAVREAGLERAEIERQSQQRIQQILRRSRFDEQNAIQDRDAVALDAVRRRRDEELQTEDESRRDQLRQLDQNLREQLRTIRRRLDEQLRTIQIRYDDQVRRAQLATQASIRIETEKFNRELAIKTQALAALLNVEQTGANNTLGVHSTFWNNAGLIATNALNALRSAGSPAQAAALPPRPRVTGGSGQFLSLDTGGRITRDGLAMVHRGEIVTNPRRGQTGNFTFAPQINGRSKSQIKRDINEQLDLFLEDLFEG
jgi:hypothetical protein